MFNNRFLTSQALQLPFATIPTIAFSSSVAIMGDFANGFGNRLTSILLSFVVISLNLFFVVSQVQEADLSSGWISFIGMLELEFQRINFNLLFKFPVIVSIAYIAFIIYLVLHMCCSMGMEKLERIPLIRKYVIKLE